jgi:hypothetical protein
MAAEEEEPIGNFLAGAPQIVRAVDIVDLAADTPPSPDRVDLTADTPPAAIEDEEPPLNFDNFPEVPDTLDFLFGGFRGR